jgi:hypothetical protein
MSYTKQNVRYVRELDDECVVNDVDVYGVRDQNVLAGNDRRHVPNLVPVPNPVYSKDGGKCLNIRIIHRAARWNAFQMGARGDYGTTSRGSHQLPASPTSRPPRVSDASLEESGVDELEQMLARAQKQIAKIERLMALREKAAQEIDDLSRKYDLTAGGRR